jgi:hypothetical protein
MRLTSLSALSNILRPGYYRSNEMYGQIQGDKVFDNAIDAKKAFDVLKVLQKLKMFRDVTLSGNRDNQTRVTIWENFNVN